MCGNRVSEHSCTLYDSRRFVIESRRENRQRQFSCYEKLDHFHFGPLFFWRERGDDFFEARFRERSNAHWSGGTLNSILASWSGALLILRRKGSQRGSEWILSKRFSVTIPPSPPSSYVIALSSHSNALSASPQKA